MKLELSFNAAGRKKKKLWKLFSFNIRKIKWLFSCFYSVKREKCVLIYENVFLPHTKINNQLFQITQDFENCSLPVENSKTNIFTRFREAFMKKKVFLQPPIVENRSEYFWIVLFMLSQIGILLFVWYLQFKREKKISAAGWGGGRNGTAGEK